jgi:hypothetical protein
LFTLPRCALNDNTENAQYASSVDDARRIAAAEVQARTRRRSFVDRMDATNAGIIILTFGIWTAVVTFVMVFTQAPIWFDLVQTSDWISVVGTRISNLQPSECDGGKTLAEGRLTYQYEVAGRTYTGTRVANAGLSHYAGRGRMFDGYRVYQASEEELDLKSRIPVGGPISLFVDPAAPHKSVVIQGYTSEFVTFLSTCLVFWSVGVCFVLSFLVLRVCPRNADLLCGLLPVEEGTRTLLRKPPRRRALAEAILAASGGFALGGFGAALLAMSGHASLATAMVVFIVPGIIVGTCVYLLRKRNLSNSEHADLIIDRASGTVRTRSSGFTFPQTVTLSDIAGVARYQFSELRPVHAKEDRSNPLGFITQTDGLCAFVPIPLSVGSLPGGNDVGEWLAARLGVPFERREPTLLEPKPR